MSKLWAKFVLRFVHGYCTKHLMPINYYDGWNLGCDACNIEKREDRSSKKSRSLQKYLSMVGGTK